MWPKILIIIDVIGGIYKQITILINLMVIYNSKINQIYMIWIMNHVDI